MPLRPLHARTGVLLLAAVAALSGCFTAAKPSTVAADIEVQGNLRLIDDGAFDLSVRCGQSGRPMPIGHSPGCDLSELRTAATSLFLVAPWQERTAGTLEGGRVRFHVDWAKTGIDPLAEDANARLDGVWHVEHAFDGTIYQTWRADAEQINRIRHYIGAATDTQYELRRGGASPSLVVVSIEPLRPLRAGNSSTIAITLKNEGAGDAYLVAAETRSSLPALHGLRYSFGTIPPGASKTRAVTIEVPRSTVETSAMLVVAFREGNDQPPDNASRRLAIEPANDAPVLSATCRVAERAPASGAADSKPAAAPPADSVPLVDAGATVRVRCRISNAGAATRGIWLSGTIAGGRAPATSPPHDLGAKATTDLELRLQVPRSARMDERVAIAVTLEIPDLDRRLTQNLVVQVARPRVCPDGKLTRAQYQSKLAELQKALHAGALTQAELDAYDAELVSCLE
jgi:hypothetical protein